MPGAEPTDLAVSDQALSGVTTVDFESYALGALPSPWSVTKTGASAIAVENTAGHGKAAVLRGSSVAGDYAIAELPFSSTDPVLRVDADIQAAAGASFVFAVNGAGGSLGARRIRLQRIPGSNVLTAQTAGVGSLDCGTLPSGAWSRITLVVRTQEHEFDVLINGAATACTGAAAQIGTPFNSLSLMDASNDGYGGIVSLDNISVTADAAPPCTPPATPPTTVLDLDFDGDALGALPPPWSVTPASGRSTARVVTATSHGRALQLHGSTRSGDYVIAGRSFSSSQTDIELQFALRPNSGSSFIVELGGAGSSLGARRIRLQRSPGSTALVASTAGTPDVSCGTVTSNTWSSVTLTVHTQNRPHTFDVSINGQTGPCTGVSAEIGTPFTGINVMDASNVNWGGDVLFDDVLVTGLGAPAGSCP